MEIAKPRNRWWIVLTSMIAMMVGPGPLLGYTFGLFIDPIAKDLGRTRADLSLAYSCSVLGTALVAPFIGKLIDRIGCRAFALGAAWLSGAGIASLALLPRSEPLIYLWFFVVGAATASFGPIVFARTVCGWFDAKRGLALGLTLAGTGLGTAFVPVIGYWLLESAGWRQAYVSLAALSILVAFPVLLLGFHRSPDDLTIVDGGSDRAVKPGYTVREAIRGREFWLLFFLILVNSAGIMGINVHLIPLLTDRGIGGGEASLIASILGIALIGGRVGGGYLADRFFAPRVLGTVFAVAAVGLFLLANVTEGPLLLLAVACLGFGTGAELDLVALLVSRYFGLRNFAELYAYIFMAYVMGTAVGPTIVGISFDATGSYQIALTVFAVLMGMSVLILLRFRPYPKFA